MIEAGVAGNHTLDASCSALLPRLARVVGDPDFAFGGSRFAVLGVAELDGNDIGGQRFAAGLGVDLNPIWPASEEW